MTPDDRIKMTLGDLVVRNALLQSEIEALKAEIQALKDAAMAGEDLQK